MKKVKQYHDAKHKVKSKRMRKTGGYKKSGGSRRRTMRKTGGYKKRIGSRRRKSKSKSLLSV